MNQANGEILSSKDSFAYSDRVKQTSTSKHIETSSDDGINSKLLKQPGISFERKDIFGKNFSKLKGQDHCIVTNLMKYLTLDGKVKSTNTSNIDKRELWLYIYYLWRHNPNHAILSKMTEFNKTSQVGHANAKLFISTVNNFLMTDLGLTIAPEDVPSKEQLILFVNSVLDKTRQLDDPISIPIFDTISQYVIEMLKREDEENESLFNEFEAKVRAKKEARDTLLRMRATVQSLEDKLVVDKQEANDIKGADLHISFINQKTKPI
jgi:hypothetical protein